MKKITTLCTHGQDFILASTQPQDAFATLAKFVAIRAEDVTDGQTNRPLTGLDVLTADTLPELIKNCQRFAHHSAYMKAHPMPALDPENPKPFMDWVKADFKAWGATVLQATN